MLVISDSNHTIIFHFSYNDSVLVLVLIIIFHYSLMLQEVLSIILRFSFLTFLVLVLRLSFALLFWVVGFAWDMEFLNIIRRRGWYWHKMMRNFFDVERVMSHWGQLLRRVVNLLSMI